jgi:hypothetical protein
MAKWLIVDPYTQTIQEIEVNEFDDISAAIGAEVFVERVILSRFPGNGLYFCCGLWVDEDGFMKKGLPVTTTTMYPAPLAGRILYGNWVEDLEDGEYALLDANCPADLLLRMFKFTDHTTDDYEGHTSVEQIGGITSIHTEMRLKK